MRAFISVDFNSTSGKERGWSAHDTEKLQLASLA